MSEETLPEIDHDSPLTAHEEMAANALIESYHKAAREAYGNDYRLEERDDWWMRNAAYEYFFDKKHKLRFQLSKGDVFSVRLALMYPGILPK